MTQTRFLSFLTVVSLFLLTACGPPWRVIRQSGPPSALRGATQIGIAFDWSRVLVDGTPEAMHLAQLPPNEQQDWMEARNSFMQTYMTELAGQTGGIPVVASTGAEPVQLIVVPTEVVRGYYRVMIAQDTRIDSSFVFTVGGQPTDEIATRAVQAANLYNPSVVNRMNDCARRLARITGQFIRQAQTQ